MYFPVLFKNRSKYKIFFLLTKSYKTKKSKLNLLINIELQNTKAILVFHRKNQILLMHKKTTYYFKDILAKEYSLENR